MRLLGFPWFVCVALGTTAPRVIADEPHLEFARALCGRGMPDLAVDYLERLSQRPPNAIRAVLPLELAKARLDLASGEKNERKRARYFDDARQAFELFLKTHPDHPRAADAALDVARLVAMQGKWLMTEARRKGDANERRSLLTRARPLFLAAGAKLDDAIRQINARLERLAAPDSVEAESHRRVLVRAKLQAELESGINLLNGALTLPERNVAELKARADEIVKARDAFNKLAKSSDDDPVSWMAQVWVGRCADELDSKSEARKIYEAVAAEKNPSAEKAASAAALLLLRTAAEETQAPDRSEQLRAIIAGLEDWLRKNANQPAAADGQMARYLLAVLLDEQAQTWIERDKAGAPVRLTTTARQQFTRVAQLFKEIADADGEYADRARTRRVGVLVTLLAERAGGDPAQLMSFEECFLTAQVEAHRLTEEQQNADARSRGYSRIAAVLRRALSLAAPDDPARDVGDARTMLVYAYLAGGDPYSAAVLGEYIGRTRLAGKQAAEATAYALQAYVSIVARARDRIAPEAEIKADQDRLRSLAAYIEKTWPDEIATDFARHQLGHFLVEERKFAEACAMLARIALDYPGVAHARFQLGASAQRAQAKDADLSAEAKSRLLRQAVDLLEQLPDPVAGSSADATLAGCLAKCQLGNLYLLDDSSPTTGFVKAAALGRRLGDLAPNLTMDPRFRPQVEIEAARLYIAGTQNRAYALAKADQLDAARQILEPILERVRSEVTAAKLPDYATESWYEGYRDVQRQVLVLALRIAIQDNQTDAAHKALTLLRRASGKLANADEQLMRLVYDLKREADESKAKGETEKRDRLEKGLVTFLDELASPNQLTSQTRAFLAHAYSGLDRHDRAADLLMGYPAPRSDDAEATTRYRNIRLSLAREHRLARQFDAAKSVLQDILGSWGKTDLAVLREKVFLLEDAGNLAAAVQECREIKRSLLEGRNEYERAAREEKAAEEAERAAVHEADRQKATEARTTAQARRNAAQNLRERYWEFDFYDTRIVLKSCQKVKDPILREQKIAAVALAIKRLEDAFPTVIGKDLRERYLELFDLEPLLKQKYAEAAGKVLTSP
jgi:TolA-binding protein